MRVKYPRPRPWRDLAIDVSIVIATGVGMAMVLVDHLSR
jgi:hypothetical protein